MWVCVGGVAARQAAPSARVPPPGIRAPPAGPAAARPLGTLPMLPGWPGATTSPEPRGRLSGGRRIRTRPPPGKKWGDRAGPHDGGSVRKIRHECSREQSLIWRCPRGYRWLLPGAGFRATQGRAWPGACGGRPFFPVCPLRGQRVARRGHGQLRNWT